MLQLARELGGNQVATAEGRLVGPDGKLMDLLPLGVPTDQVVAAVRKLL